MSVQAQITGDLKVREIEGGLYAEAGIVSSKPFGGANGFATLGGDGKVPSSQLPSYVDDVVEVPTYADLPVVGESGKIYVTLDTNKIYRWTGSTYVEIVDSTAVWGAITGTLSNQTDLQNALNAKVPYTGATANVDLGTYGLLGDYIGFNTAPTSVPTTLGTLSWDSFYRTLQLIDGDGDTTLQIGQEQRALIHNNTGATLTDGQVVYVTGSTGELPSVALASNATEASSSVTFGVVTESIAHGANGFVTISGMVNGLNTLAYNEGDALYLGSTAGTFTNVKPTAPANLVLIGYMIKKSGGNGSIFVKIQNGYELEELHDVSITSVANNEGIFWDSATSLWKNKTIAGALGYTPANDSLVVHLAGTETITGLKTFSQDITVNSVNVGKGAGSGEHNVAIGDNVLTDNTTGNANIGIGTFPLWHNTTGFGNIAIGREALIASQTGSLNIAIGDNTMKGVVTGGQNIAIGANVAQSATSGSNNLMIGYSAATMLTTGANNLFLGYGAGGTITTGNYNTIIGGFPSFSSAGSLSNNVIIADGQGNIRFQWNGSQTLISGTPLGSNAFTSTSYLPLSGGTLTGTLNGTSATFSGLISGDIGYLAGINNSGAARGYATNYQNNASSRSWRMIGEQVAYGDFQIQQSTTQTGSTYATKFYISATGNVGIGTSSPDLENGGGQVIYNSTVPRLAFRNSTSGTTSLDGTDLALVSSDFYVFNRESGSIIFGTSATEKMRITSGGTLSVNSSSPNTDAVLYSKGRTSGGDGYNLMMYNSGGGELFVSRNDGLLTFNVPSGGSSVNTVFNNSATSTPAFASFRISGTGIGSITGSGSITSYNITSDYRLKQDFKDYNGLELISKIKTYDFEWKLDKTRMFGVIAHELQEVIPYAVFGEKDDEEMQQVDYSKITPINTKAIQELYDLVLKQQAQIEELKAKIK